MNLAKKSQAVLDLFGTLESEAKKYVSEGGLSCINGCGFCCSNPKISASPLEFLPLAFDLYEKGLAEASIRILEANPEPSNCILYRPQSEDGKKGFCSNYRNRGMICRVFGTSARRNKFGRKELITCKVLKEEKSGEFMVASERINEGLDIPMAVSYYTQLREIDESLCDEYVINEAIRRALELVLRFKFYEEGEMNPET
ncbi:YkgJ family cysteine cluster protein [Algoriphagus sp. CAU 1675]|uniref:YkgJ family cysteine cluster protein n=1 Tax=Algoriphagus sp. CAU 1675 TaxID=3032597 RepID=UPI0023DA0B33|nr:YkgJ family cysteine cluster protein [Algoriphagus sp. CAU 1675]MDF2156633.1 YkgJ family cysteine cluster protein [Algoriphagus sp. CAU 1675]